MLWKKRHGNDGGFGLVGKLVINAIALLIVEYIVPGFELLDARALVVTAIIMAVVNTFIKPVVQIIALPLSILTLGIAAFFVNVLLLYVIAAVTPGFEIDSFLTATIASILLSLVSAFLHKAARD